MNQIANDLRLSNCGVTDQKLVRQGDVPKDKPVLGRNK